MRGLMMDRPLLISSLIEHAGTVFHDQEIVSRTVEGPIHRYTYRALRDRSRQLANALTRLGIRPGDRVATIAWNAYRHIEAYYAVSGLGGVCHTMNPRLHPDQLAYIVGHAKDRMLLVDSTFVPIVEAVADRIPTVEHVVVMTDNEHMPETRLPNLVCYEELIAGESTEFSWPEFDERTASSLCYTSGTTGNPKGVLYSHRSTILHAYAFSLPDVAGLGEDEVLLPVVPMFHVNAWGLPYGAAITGSKVVLPGPSLDGKSLTELMNAERVTLAAGVPTVWLGLLHHLAESGERLPTVRRMIVGGAAPPRSMIQTFQEEYGIDFRQAWGMTEMSPLGTVSRIKPSKRDASADERYAIQTKQGRPVFGVDLKIVDRDGERLPHDGKAFGELFVRGPWIASAYYGLEGADSHDDEGWFGTGDVATIDQDGYMQITDRLKDVIKSGGEWISSIELENLAASHPDVAQAAVIGVPDEKWDERPLLLVVLQPNTSPTKEELLGFMEGKVAKWWIPDDVVFIEALPIGATGKVLKGQLREEHSRTTTPGARPASADR